MITPHQFDEHKKYLAAQVEIKKKMPKPDICIGASRVEEMHWNLYEMFTQKMNIKMPKPIMFSKSGMKPNPEYGTITQNDKETIESIYSIL